MHNLVLAWDLLSLVMTVQVRFHMCSIRSIELPYRLHFISAQGYSCTYDQYSNNCYCFLGSIGHSEISAESSEALYFTVSQ